MRYAAVVVGFVCLVAVCSTSSARADCTTCTYCSNDDCSCSFCNGSGICNYCNLLGCNCDPCPTGVSCIPAQSSTKKKLGASARSTVAVARGARLFREIDKNADGRISRAELAAWVKQNAAEFQAIAGKRTSDQVFDDLDKSKKGYFTLADAGCSAAAAVGK